MHAAIVLRTLLIIHFSESLVTILVHSRFMLGAITCISFEGTSCWSAAERANFPTDLYMLEGLIRQLGSKYVLRLADNDGEINSSITADVAVVVLTHVSFRTGRMLDMAKYTQLAHEAYATLCAPHAESN